jgi:hypothetical protein
MVILQNLALILFDVWRARAAGASPDAANVDMRPPEPASPTDNILVLSNGVWLVIGGMLQPRNNDRLGVGKPRRIAVLVRFRRMLGLYAFFYATLHFAAYLVLDLRGYWAQIFEEIAKRPYITVGFAAWLLLVPLALTSTQAAIRRLGRALTEEVACAPSPVDPLSPPSPTVGGTSS